MRVRLPSSGTFGAQSAWSNFDTLLQRLAISTDPNFWDGLQSLISYQDYFLESQYHDLQEGCEPGETQQGPNKPQTPTPPNTPNPECLCANSPFYAWEIHGIECAEYRLLYWYHPDYLGHNEFITDNSGLPYQYFHYSGFGETLVEDNAQYGQFSSPYRFNAKELDGETGNYYYGASSRRDFEHKPKGRSATLARPSPAFWRGYYNPIWSVWLGVDPLAHDYRGMSPYVFTGNNPIMLMDPDGRKIIWSLDAIRVWFSMRWTKKGRENWTVMHDDEFVAFAFRISSSVGVSRRADGRWSLVEGETFEEYGSECTMVVTIYKGTHRVKKGAEQRYQKNWSDIKEDNQYSYINSHVRVRKENIELIEDTGNKTATIHRMDETYILETYEQGSKHGYTNTSRMNENTTEYIGRLGRHESTHALVNSGVWKDMYPSTPERFPEERE